MLGRAPKAEAVADDQPQCPLELAYLWGWFIELSYGLTPGFGPAMATWDNIGWWAQLMRIAPEPWEARLLAELSIMRANALAAEAKKQKPKPEPANGVQGHKRRRR